MKQLVLFLKPLEEMIQAVGMKERWRPKLNECLRGLSIIFPHDKAPKNSPPNSLVESYL